MEQASLSLDAHAVLLPAVTDLSLGDDVLDLLRGGMRALILGETAAEYDAGRMFEERIANEEAEQFVAVTRAAREAAGAPVVIAVDQELGGIERLHRLATPLPPRGALSGLDTSDLEVAAANHGRSMTALGVNLTLAPTLDVVQGTNPWLATRHLGDDPTEVSRVTSAFIRGLAGAGVGATAKHFPGCGPATVDPHYSEVRITSTREEYDEVHLAPFRAAFTAGAAAVMAGPAVVESIDPTQPVSTSAAHVRLLRTELGFGGVIMTVDLDSPATARGRSVPEAGVDALIAGLDLLMIGAPGHGAATVSAIMSAVESGALPRGRLSDAATRVRELARRLDITPESE